MNEREPERHIDYQRIYKAVPIFSDLTEDELADILRISRLFRAAAGTTLVREGESGTGMYILVNGSARVTVRQDEIEDTTLAVLTRGDTIGELNLIDSAPHSATVTCVELCTLFHIDADAFNGLRADGHPGAFKVLRAIAPLVCARLRQINGRIAAIFADPERSMAEIEKVRMKRAAMEGHGFA